MEPLLQRSHTPVLSTRPVKKLSTMSPAKMALTSHSKRARSTLMAGPNAVSYGTVTAV